MVETRKTFGRKSKENAETGKNLGEDMLSDAGSLLADAFASMVRYSAARFESESAWLVEWEIKIEQAHNDLVGGRD